MASTPILAADAGPIDRASPLDRQHPLARGLVGFWRCDGSSLRDLAGRNPLVPTSSAPFVNVPGLGRAFKADGTNYALNNTATGLGDCSAPFTIAFVRYRTNTVDYGHVFTIGTGTAGVNVDFGWSGAGQLSWMRGTNGATVISSPMQYDDFVVEFNALTYDGTTATIWLRNAVVASGTVGAIDTGKITRLGLFINSNASFAQVFPADYRVGSILLYSRRLSSAELDSLSRIALAGYPGLLRRIDLAAWAGPSVAAGRAPPRVLANQAVKRAAYY